MHRLCGRRSNVFVTNDDRAGLQTHDCCTRHSCARKLAEAQACIEGDRPMSQCTPDITSPLVQWQAIPIAEWERIEAVVTAAKAWVAYITEGSGADNGKFDRLVGAVRALDAAAGGTSKGSEANRWAARFGAEQSRAERAEADFDEVKAEHRDHLRMCDGRLDRLKQANAALDRVRALCEELHDTDEIVTEAYDRLRAALAPTAGGAGDTEEGR
jgi:hypothetical protein